jgi:thiol-disulfide isomerase/thioredoxin
MKWLLYFSSLVFILFSCFPKELSTQENIILPSVDSIHLDGKAVVRIIYSDNSKSRLLSASTNNILPPADYFEVKDTIPAGNGYKDIVYQVRSFQKGFLSIDHYRQEIYLAPFDTLVVMADLSPSKGWIAKEWKGAYAFASRYYAARDKLLALNLSQRRAQVANSAPNLESYQQQMDSLLEKELSLLDQSAKKNALPPWFVEEERNQIRYNDAQNRLNTLLYRDYLKKEKIKLVPGKFYSFITKDLLDNQKAKHLYDYHRFIEQYFTILILKEDKLNPMADPIPLLADQYLSGQVKDLFMTRYINGILANDPTGGEKLLRSYYSTFKDKELINKIKTYYEHAYKLKEGEQAPYFYLQEGVDSFISLKELEGNVVYMGFWFVGCAPCIAEMPYENALVEKFKDKNVKIVSVCVRSSRENWMKMSQRYGLKTINLFANSNWEKKLTEKYNIEKYPHYVLIDKQGQIVKNDCSRPSGDIVDHIEKLL